QIASISFGLFLCALSGGCGVVTAPLSVPGAVAQNANFSFSGTVVNTSGEPMTGILLTQELDRPIWAAIEGGGQTHGSRLRRVDGNFVVKERGHELSMEFHCDGYLDAQYSIYAANPKSVWTPSGYWPNVGNFPVVMISNANPDATLSRWNGNIYL